MIARAALAALTLGLLAGCSDSGGDSEASGSAAPMPHYVGISEAMPTGSEWIDPGALVAAYDISSTTSDGLLRDFGPSGIHGTFPPRAEPIRLLVEGATSPGRPFRDPDDRIYLPSAEGFDLDGPLTIAAWVRVDSLGIHQHIAACDDKWSLWITPANQYRLGIRNAGWSSPEGTVTQGVWTPVVAILHGTRGDPIDESTMAMYVNGELASAAAHLRSDEARELGVWNPGELFPTDACSLGFESHQGMESHKTLPFVGVIDEVLVFARAWSEAEVQAFSRIGG